MLPTKYNFDNPKREEYRLPNRINLLTGDTEIVRHRGNDEPAVLSAKGYKAWYQDGLRHRIGGPAIEFEDFKAYYQNGKLHRVDGPALEFSDGSKQFWINGVRTK